MIDNIASLKINLRQNLYDGQVKTLIYNYLYPIHSTHNGANYICLPSMYSSFAVGVGRSGNGGGEVLSSCLLLRCLLLFSLQ